MSRWTAQSNKYDLCRTSDLPTCVMHYVQELRARTDSGCSVSCTLDYHGAQLRPDGGMVRQQSIYNMYRICRRVWIQKSLQATKVVRLPVCPPLCSPCRFGSLHGSVLYIYHITSCRWKSNKMQEFMHIGFRCSGAMVSSIPLVIVGLPFHTSQILPFGHLWSMIMNVMLISVIFDCHRSYQSG